MNDSAEPMDDNGDLSRFSYLHHLIRGEDTGS